MTGIINIELAFVGSPYNHLLTAARYDPRLQASQVRNSQTHRTRSNTKTCLRPAINLSNDNSYTVRRRHEPDKMIGRTQTPGQWTV